MTFLALLLFMAGAHADVAEGNTDSTVKVQIYEDLQGGDCARFEAILQQKLLPKYGTRVVFVHHDFPLGRHDWARDGAIASRWVYEQDPRKGIDFRRQLMSEQDHLTSQNLKAWMSEFAVRNQLDPKAIVDSLKDPRYAALVDQDRTTAGVRGVTKAPTVFVHGETLVETVVYDDVARALDEALK